MANGQRAFDLLKELAYERLSGTAEELRAAQRLQAECQSIGVDAAIEGFTVHEGVVHTATLEVLEPYCKKYEITGFERSASTAPDGEEMELVYVEDMLDVNMTDVKGKFILLNGGVTYEVYEKLQKADIRGFLTFSGSLRDKIEESDLAIKKIRPIMSDAFGFAVCANVRVADAMEMVEKGATKIRINIQSELVDWTSHNVVATIPGTKYPDEIVSYGAHYDSVPFSQGVYDNGAGSVILMEMLRYFKENPPARTVKFMWYGSEEVGLLGSKAYIADHEEELSKHRLMINVDVAGPILGRDFCIVTGEKKVEDYIAGMMLEAGYAVKMSQDIYSSDCMPFANAGIPAVNFGRSCASGAGFLHDRHDTMAFLSPASFQKTTEIVELFSSRVVNAHTFPIAKSIPADIDEKVKKYLKLKK